MSDVDKKIFPSDSRTFEYLKFIIPYYVGLRVYVLMDPLDTFPKSKLKLRKLKYIHYILKYSFITLLVWLLYVFLMKRLLSSFLWSIETIKKEIDHLHAFYEII